MADTGVSPSSLPAPTDPGPVQARATLDAPIAPTNADPGGAGAGANAPQAGGTQAAANAGPQEAASSAPPPAAQLAHAVAALHVGADGSSHTMIKLDPVELGQVQIRISRAVDGTASVTVAVERPETLASLQSDLGHLHQALDRAGVSDQRSLVLHLATQADAGGTAPFGTGTGGAPQGGSQQGARQERQQAAFAGPSGGTAMPSPFASAAPIRTPGAASSGVNITA